MRRLFYGFSLLALLMLFACSGDDVTSDQNGGNSRNAGMLRLYMTDQPLQAKEVWVTFNEIQIHRTGGGWETFDDSPQTLDLLTLQDSQELIALGELEAGKYTGIRFQITEAHLIDLDEQRCDLKVPSNKIHVNANFEIGEDETTNVVLDFDAEKSVHVVRRGHNESCILRPVVNPV